MSGSDALHGRRLLVALGFGAVAVAVPLGLAAAWLLVIVLPHVETGHWLPITVAATWWGGAALIVEGLVRGRRAVRARAGPLRAAIGSAAVGGLLAASPGLVWGVSLARAVLGGGLPAGWPAASWPAVLFGTALLVAPAGLTVALVLAAVIYRQPWRAATREKDPGRGRAAAFVAVTLLLMGAAWWRAPRDFVARPPDASDWEAAFVTPIGASACKPVLATLGMSAAPALARLAEYGPGVEWIGVAECRRVRNDAASIARVLLAVRIQRIGQVRQEALASLAALLPESAPLLIPLLLSPDEEVSFACAEWIDVYETDPAMQLAPWPEAAKCVAILGEAGRVNTRYLYPFVQTLRRFGPPSIPVLLGLFRGHSAWREESLYAAAVAAAQGLPAEREPVARLLLEQLSAGWGGFPMAAIHSVVALGPPFPEAVGPLLILLDTSPGPLQSAPVLDALGIVGRGDAAAGARVGAMISDPNSSLRSRAAVAYWAITGDRERARASLYAHPLSHVDSTDWWFHLVLADLSSRDPAALGLLAGALRARCDVEDVARVIRLGPDAVRAVAPALRSWLTGADPRMRDAVKAALATIGEK